MPTSKLAATCVAAGALIAVGGCGGGSKTHASSSTSSTTATTPPASTTTAKKVTPAPVPKVLTESVLRALPVRPFGPSIKAKPGQSLVFRTVVPPALAKGGTARVRVQISEGPGPSVTVTAHAKGQTSTATVTSASGKPVSLLDLSYACSLPPAETFCPLSRVSKSGTSVQFRAVVKVTTPIVLSAVVGPLNVPAPSTKAPGTLVVPAYTVTEFVRPLPLKSAKKTPPATFAPSATVSPGQIVTFDTLVKGQIGGAPQPVTVKIAQGPSKSIQITASASGGTKSTATLKSSNGQPITLVSPRFFCTLPPYPTFCPPTSVSTAFHSYSLTFSAAPSTPAILLYAQIQAG